MYESCCREVSVEDAEYYLGTNYTPCMSWYLLNSLSTGVHIKQNQSVGLSVTAQGGGDIE